jgi:ABC-type transporter Mla subunit MlaD
MDWSLLFPSKWNPWILIQDLTSNDPQLGSKALSALFILVIIALALGFIFWAVVISISSILKTNRYYRSLPDDGDAIFNPKRKKLPLLNEFNKYLITLPSRDGTNQNAFRRTIDAEEVFSDTKLAPSFSSSRLYLAMPGILTGLGVLGTFVGLQIGIGGLDLIDPRILKKSIIPLIQGCVIAFSTSVWGVFASLSFSGVEKLVDSIALRRVRLLQSRVDSLFQRYVPEEAMAELERASRGTEEILKGLAVAIGEEMQKAIGRLGNDIKDAVAKATSEGQDYLMEKSADLLSQTITAELANLSNQVKDMGDSFQGQFSAANDGLIKSMQTLEPTVKSLSTIVDGAQKNVAAAVGRLNGHEEIMKKMGHYSEKLQEAANSFAEMNDTLRHSSENNKEAADAQLASSEVNRRVAEKFEKVGEKLPEIENTLNDAAKVIVSISSPVNELKTCLQNLPENQREIEENRALSEDQRNKLLLQMTDDLAEKVSGAAEQFSKVEKLADKLAEAAKTLDDASNELATFGHHVINASNDQRKASEASLAAASIGEQTAKALAPLPDSFIKLKNGLETAGEKLSEGSVYTRDFYRELIDLQERWFKGAEIGLTAMKDRVQSIIESYGDQIEGNTQMLMKKWTDEVTSCLKTYETQISQLQDDLEAFQETIDRINNQ